MKSGLPHTLLKTAEKIGERRSRSRRKRDKPYYKANGCITEDQRDKKVIDIHRVKKAKYKKENSKSKRKKTKNKKDIIPREKRKRRKSFASKYKNYIIIIK
ncbi:hypothetical protein Ahia01_000301400, partial [Argonauta hians]